MSIEQIIASGLLELYVIGDLSPSEILLVEEAMEKDESIRREIAEIEKALEAYAFANAIPVAPTLGPLLFATINFSDRLKNGEITINPPSLNASSKIVDYSLWLEREDMQAPDEYDSSYAKIINSDEEKTTMIVWLKDNAPEETHTNEYEKFLIVEGSCDITIGDEVHSLKRGDFLAIPLFIKHTLVVTSTYACKVILERAAA